MTLLAGLAILVVVAIPLVISIHRANELFVAEVRKGRVHLRRGRAPAALLSDLQDVVQSPRVVSAKIRVVSEDGRPRAFAQGQLSEAHAQRIRNVVGTWPVAKIRAGRKA